MAAADWNQAKYSTVWRYLLSLVFQTQRDMKYRNKNLKKKRERTVPLLQRCTGRREAYFHRYKYNVSVNNTILYFIHNKKSILSGRHVSTFIKSSSRPLGKPIQELSIFQRIVGSQMQWSTDSSWICFPRGPEDDLIKVETCCPDNILFLLCIK